MSEVKPSQLPCFTVIEDSNENLFMRDSLGGWSLVFPRDITDADFHEVLPEDADIRFQEFTIRAVPEGWTPNDKVEDPKEAKRKLEEIYVELDRRAAASDRIDLHTSGVHITHHPMNDPKMGPPNPPNPSWNKPYG